MTVFVLRYLSFLDRLQAVDRAAAESGQAISGVLGRYDGAPADPADDYVQVNTKLVTMLASSIRVLFNQ
jgi:hypothetical protein